HYLSGLQPYCASYGAVLGVEDCEVMPTNSDANRMTCRVVNLYERSVLIHIGEPLELLEPVISMVELKALDSCYMKGVESLEGIESTVYPLVEFTFAVFDRELRKILDNPAVQPRKFCDEIVESRAEIICS